MIDIWDAHCHRSLVGETTAMVDGCEFGIQRAIINTTRPSDWPKLADQAFFDEDGSVCLAGLHPWFIDASRGLPWRDGLTDLLAKGLAGIGEIGLDGGRAKRKAGFAEQVEVFQWQLLQSTERNLPVSIHAVRANNVLIEALKGIRLPERGIHLHDFHAPVEVIRQLQRITEVWFSYGPRRLLHGSQDWPQQVLPSIPHDRLLFETDCQIEPTGDSSEVEWPDALLQLAQWRQLPVAELAVILNRNTRKYFLGC